jgi:hypothetical protein
MMERNTVLVTTRFEDGVLVIPYAGNIVRQAGWLGNNMNLFIVLVS